MRVLRWPAPGATPLKRSVATLGVFDGVHRGHAEVIRRVLAAADERACPSAVVTFDRHPASALSGELQPAITSLEHRLRLLEALGLEVCVVVQFSRDVAAMDAEDFARLVFRDLLGAQLVVLGFDSRFGRGGRGRLELLRQLSPELGFDVEVVHAVEVDGEVVSSTAIRRAILDGRFDDAEGLLGRPVSLYGTVVPGDGIGDEIGCPTANLELHNETIPPDGVYATWAFTDHDPLPSVTSVGRRGTFHPEADAPRTVEVHLIGRDEELRGRDIEVRFVALLRPQRTFKGAKELAQQIERDIRDALEVLKSNVAGTGGR